MGTNAALTMTIPALERNATPRKTHPIRERHVLYTEEQEVMDVELAPVGIWPSAEITVPDRGKDLDLVLSSRVIERTLNVIAIRRDEERGRRALAAEEARAQ